jgi:hypothetical protein
LDDITPIELPPPEPPPAPAPHSLPFQRPADYYSTPGSRLRPIFPRWVPIGCGWAALIFVILLFAGGAFAPRSGSILDMLFGKIQDDLVQHFSKDVTAAQRASFDFEMHAMRASAKNGKLKLDRTQKFLRLATEVDGDEKIDHVEADKLIAAAHDVNQSVK